MKTMQHLLVAIWLSCFLSHAFANQMQTKQQKNLANIAYSIQVGSFKQLENAGNLADSLNKKGLDAFFFKENEMYKVRFGNYDSLQAANQKATQYQKQKLIGDFIIIKPSAYAINQKISQTDKLKTIRANLSKNAHQYIGVPYKWGGTNSSGFDCSGLVRAVYQLSGFTLPRTSRDQFLVGKFVLQSKLQIGDLVFFNTGNGSAINHVGIYIGNGKFIHAPGKGKKVTIASLSASYWKKVYKGGRTYL